MRRYLFAVLTVVLVGMFVFPVAAGAGAAKKDVCHSEGNGSYHLINISENAFQKHVDHGDGSPGDLVPGMEDYKFGDDCSLVLAVVDTDGDGVPDDEDNCPTVANADQSDRYGSPLGDACETDSDGNGVLDVDEPFICVHIDGVPIIEEGAPISCDSSAPTTGAPSNIAVAHGEFATAFARDGDNNTATATGFGATARAFIGDNNTATATGEYANARASNGDNNTATTTSSDPSGSSARASNGDNNTATATGGAFALARDGNDNIATATGDDADARARFGDRNEAIANGGCTAEAGGSIGMPVNDDFDMCTL